MIATTPKWESLRKFLKLARIKSILCIFLRFLSFVSFHKMWNSCFWAFVNLRKIEFMFLSFFGRTYSIYTRYFYIVRFWGLSSICKEVLFIIVIMFSCSKLYIRFVFAAMPVVNLPLAVIRCLYAGSYVLRLHSHSHFGVVPSMLEVRRANIMNERNH